MLIIKGLLITLMTFSFATSISKKSFYLDSISTNCRTNLKNDMSIDHAKNICDCLIARYENLSLNELLFISKSYASQKYIGALSVNSQKALTEFDLKSAEICVNEQLPSKSR